MPKLALMKTIRLVPLLLAGFCGYLHTVINRRFDEIGGLMSQSNGHPDMMDAPNSMLASLSASSTSSSLQQQQQQTKASNDGNQPIQSLNLGKMQGPAADLLDTGRDNFDMKPPPPDMRVMVGSDDYEERLLQFTMNLLPNHRDRVWKVACLGMSDLSKWCHPVRYRVVYLLQVLARP